MNAKWNYETGNVAFADGTGTYAEGWYAAAPSTVECGQSPDAGPYATREQAEKQAIELATTKTNNPKQRKQK